MSETHEHTNQATNKLRTIATPFEFEIARRNVEGFSDINKFARATVGASEISIWDGNTAYPWITTASKLKISSDDAADTATTGTGAWTVIVYGLDANYNEINEVLEMNGTTEVETENTYIRVYRMFVLTAGTGGGAAGTISLKQSTTTVAKIVNGNNQTLMGVYTIPAGKTGYFLYGKASASAGKSIDGKVYVRFPDTVFAIKHTYEILETTYEFKPVVPIVLPAKSDIDFRAISSAAGAIVSVAFGIILVDDPVAG
jgi:hypothetical protein